MQVRVRLYGLARSLAEAGEVSLELPSGATYADVTAALAMAYPALVNLVIAPDGRSLLSGNLFCRSEDEVIDPDQMDRCPAADELLLLVPVIVGGSAN